MLTRALFIVKNGVPFEHIQKTRLLLEKTEFVEIPWVSLILDYKVIIQKRIQFGAEGFDTPE